jgi:hypothetical protein
VNGKGERKVSIGRAPLLVVLVIMCYYYAKTGVGPDAGTLSFIGLAMAYNGFSKSPLNSNNKTETTTKATTDTNKGGSNAN